MPDERCYKSSVRDRARTRKWQEDNRERYRAYIRRYGRVKSGVKDATGEEKTGPCEICGRIKKLHFDHDHATGLHRGWLCPVCNGRLGWLEKHKLQIESYLGKSDG